MAHLLEQHLAEDAAQREAEPEPEAPRPAPAVLVKKAVGLAKGTGTPSRETVGTITRAQLEAIAKEKAKDLNAKDLEGAVRMIMGTCRSMGVKVEG